MKQGTASKNCDEGSISLKKLILMCGLPGAGKTTTAHRIREAIGDAIVISRDHHRLPYRGNGCLNEYSNGNATIDDYRFYACVEQFFSIYSTVILDATFREWIKRQSAYDFANRFGCRLLLIECICSHRVLLQRLQLQTISGEKNFIKPLEEVLEYYIKNTQPLKNELHCINFIQFDTEKNCVLSKSLQNNSHQLIEQVVKILEHPITASIF